jgi:hypothetical protein
MFKDAKDYDINMRSLAKLGRTVSAETRAKMSANRKGKKISAETRAKISATLKGRPAPNKGKTVSAETRAKISATATIYIYHTPAGVFNNLSAAAKANKCSYDIAARRCTHEKHKDWYKVKKVDNT